MKPSRPKTLPKKAPSKSKTVVKDPVLVHCRIRPMQNGSDVAACMSALSSSSVRLTPPDTATNYRNGIIKEVIYTFNHVFDQTVSQKEVFDTVALPLVEALVQGRNGLLFAYGVTGSGKTYTMNGEPQDGGIMPRSLDVLFNSIANFQAKKYTFKPDKMNGFDIQSDVDALQERQQELIRNLDSRPMKTPRKNSDLDILARQPDSTRVEVLDEDNAYAVFVTYVEIYNNCVYDLLEEISEDMLRNKQLQVRIIREDAMKNMYVHGVTEIEVKSPEEAFEAFYRGQQRKRVANTMLNAESSRSHSIFTIRLVQAPLDVQGDSVVQDKQSIIVSQFSLVDLAGCERTNRTKNSGKRLREAGNINNSLMTLRSCLEILRENQMQGANKIVPYRDSKLTHLFKSYLDGEGQVRMIVCASPRAEDYDENLQVMKFAEMSQEVQVARPPPINFNTGFTPGRRRANQIFRTAVQQLEEDGIAAADIPINVDVVYSLASDFPSMNFLGPDGGGVLAELKSFLQDRVERRHMLHSDLVNRQEQFRVMLAGIEKDSIISKQESNSLRNQLERERLKVTNLQNKLSSVERLQSGLQRRNVELEVELTALRQENADMELALNQRALDKQKIKQRYNAKVAIETEKVSHELEKKLEKHRQQLQSKIREKDEKLRRMKQILIEENGVPSVCPSSDLESKPEISTPSIPFAPKTPSFDSRRMGMAIRNPRHRRSKSAEGAGRWLDHCPATPVALSTIFQPIMKKRKSVTKLTDVKDITKGTERYCLTTQQQDTDGELETRLYKGDVLPTCSGGAQVVFNDVELLKQTSPTGNNCGPVTRKRSAQIASVDVSQRCAMAVEGHGKRPHISS